MLYLLNSAVLTAFGRWEYREISIDALQARLQRCAWPFCAEPPLWHATPGCVCVHSSGQGDDGQPCAECLGTGQRHHWRPRWESTIWYAETAAALEALAQLPTDSIPVRRQTVTMQPGDEAIVCRLVLPPGSPRIDPADKGAIAGHLHNGHWEVGCLTRQGAKK